MRGMLTALLLGLLLALAPRPAAAGSFDIALPTGSAVTIDAPSRLVFWITNTGTAGELSRLTLHFPAGYRVTGGSPPPGWIIERRSGDAAGPSDEITFRTKDEAACTAAIASGESLAFGVRLVAPAFRALSSDGKVIPDGLLAVRAAQTCRGLSVEPPAVLPTWDRLGLEVALAAAPLLLRVGDGLTVTMTLTNISSVVLRDVSAFLRPGGSGSVGGLAGPTPEELTLEPGATGILTWTARTTAAGTVRFSGQAVGRGLIAPPVRSNLVWVSDFGPFANRPPEQGDSDQEGGGGMGAGGSGAVGLASAPASPSANSGTPAASGGTSASTGSSSGSGGTSGTVTSPSATFQFIPLNQKGQEGPPTQGGSFAGVRDLRILVGWQNLSGSHTQRLELFSPNGVLYQRFTIPFDGSSSVDTRIPVGGTWITEHSLFGKWRAQVYLDSNRTPIASTNFVLNP
jgi:hypothetical protein